MLMRAWMILLVAVSVGCGSSKPAGPALIPTEGMVTLKDKPVAGATLFFHPEGKEGLTCAANSDDSGKFVLWTNGKTGAAAGRYRVTVKSYTKKDGSPLIVTDEDRANGVDADQLIAAGLAKLSVPPQYLNPHTTTLTVEVLPNGSPPLQIAMK
jgi:hypothetical protein